MPEFKLYQTVCIAEVEQTTLNSVVKGQSLPVVGHYGVVVDDPSPGVYTVEHSMADGSLGWLADFPSSALACPKPVPFEVEGFMVLAGSPVLFVRQLTSHNFTLLPGSTIAGHRIKDVQIPRAIDSQGRQRYDYFAFTLVEAEGLAVTPGAHVHLDI